MPIEKNEGYKMSAADREALAQTVVARLFDAAKDKDKAAEVVDVWVGEIDRAIGAAVRKALMWVATAATIVLAIKLGALEKIGGWFK